MVMMLGKKVSTLKLMTSITSDGFRLPREAWPKVLMSVMVITTVTNITKVAPKLRASSLRREEWNNITEN
jgi:hypothetical protein